MQPNYLKLDPKPAHRLLSRCMMGNVMTPKIPSWRADQLPESAILPPILNAIHTAALLCIHSFVKVCWYEWHFVAVTKCVDSRKHTGTEF